MQQTVTLVGVWCITTRLVLFAAALWDSAMRVRGVLRIASTILVGSLAVAHLVLLVASVVS